MTQGDNVKLQCDAEGNPYPTITWSKQEGHLRQGVESERVIINKCVLIGQPGNNRVDLCGI